MILGVLLAVLTAKSSADVTPSRFFSDHAVVQAGHSIPVWGVAEPDEHISVNFAGERATTTADKQGNWFLRLPPQTASPIGRDLVIAGQNSVVFRDVVVGELWLASGQSNMYWPMSQTHDAELDLASADAFPLIRHLNVGLVAAESPQGDLPQSKPWQVAGTSGTSDFSAVAYLFSRELHLTLNVPVGIIHSSWGGTPVQSWMSASAIAADPAALAVQARWESDRPSLIARTIAQWEEARIIAERNGDSFDSPKPGPDFVHRHLPSSLFNAMIHPLAPLPISGVIWYQGEGNVKAPQNYYTLFPSLIRDWRRHFENPELPFLWVQLPNYAYDNLNGIAAATLREAQTAALALPNTGQAVAIDLGNDTDIHPRNKLSVARRLARLALNRVYRHDIADSGPEMATTEPSGSSFRITFSNTGEGLVSPVAHITGFEIAGPDRLFHQATVVPVGGVSPLEQPTGCDTILVSSPRVSNPIAVRYAWRNAPAASLFNSEGLPARPFRTDDW